MRYSGRISGPLLDRFDLVVEVPRLTPEELARAPEGESTAAVRERVLAARERMKARQGKLNSELFGRALRQHTVLSPSSEALLQAATKPWPSPQGATTASCGWPAPSPTSQVQNASRRPTWSRR